jgi:uncharacterized protein YyaL (SSP411 family)
MMKNICGICCTGLMLFMLSCSKSKITPPVIDTSGKTPPGGNVSVYLTKARATHDFIVSSYLTSFGGYRVNLTDNSNTAFEWYNASQLYADAAMVAAGDTTYRKYMNNTFAWLTKLVDQNDAHGGYFAAAALNGGGGSGLKYVDDNSLTGVTYLEAYDVSTGSQQAKYLQAAQACADWIINSGLWDNTFGGGFWWNTAKPVKSTQTNGLALQLFLRLYIITGQVVYHDWALQINNWLNTKMHDQATNLYIWQIESSGTVDKYIFTYDNAIMVEADLLYAKAMNDPSYVTKAQALGNAMIKTLYDTNHNVFIFNTNDIRINPCYSGWASQAMIKLYETDNNSSWLTYAKANIDQINAIMENPAVNGYYQYAGLDGAGRYANMEGVDQAWMQRVETLLSKYR